ncbi:unnamed protein product [Effrenium voratum]|nr:unnamed protein product [Effrenium voratum]CAJ1436635.1 unnamed protein product [Effrenium voratum]
MEPSVSSAGAMALASLAAGAFRTQLVVSAPRNRKTAGGVFGPHRDAELCRATAAYAAYLGSRRLRCQRRAVLEAPVAAPKATVEEETRQKRADQYRLLLFTEVLMSFTDTDGDNIRLQKEGMFVNEYVNDRLEIRRMEYFDIDEKARSYHDPTGRGWFRSSEDVAELVRKKELMFIERDFLARCLMTVCGLKESSAYQVMMQAHTEGVAVVGTYAFETAETYCAALNAKGLSAEIVPVDGE